MAEIICPQCKAVNKDTARYCSECGASLLGSTPLPPDSRASRSSLKTGLLLQDRYRIVKELGRGGFGAVYRAWDTRLNKAVAVKENMETSPEAQRQFAREALILANLYHPNLPRVTDHFSLPEQGQYLVMDYVEGEDLETQVRTQGVVPVEQALTWIIQVADALDYLHGQEPPVFHRDVKPANVRITPKGKAMLVDFGLVKVSSPQLKTTMGARAISPGYAPPEQYGQGRTDARTDIYALAATLYRLVTGNEPLESVLRITGDALIPAGRVNPDVPPQISQVIERGMALDPEKRYQSAEIFRSDLQRGLEAVRTTPYGPVKPVIEPTHTYQAQPFVEAPVRPVSRSPEKGKANRTQVVTPEYPTQDMQGAVAPGIPLRTQIVEEFPTPSGPGFGMPSTARIAEIPTGQPPARGIPRWLLFIGIGGIGFVLLIVGIVATISLSSGGTSDKTATAEIEDTLVARVQGTSTKMAQDIMSRQVTATAKVQDAVYEQASATAKAQEANKQPATAEAQASQTAVAASTAMVKTQKTSTSQAKSQATTQALTSILAPLGINASPKLKYGPVSDRLLHDTDDKIEVDGPDTEIKNFLAEVELFAPYSITRGEWDYGFGFRDIGKNEDYRIVLLSDKTWRFERGLNQISEGNAPGLKVGENESNFIQLVVIDAQGWLFVNETQVARLNLSALLNPGTIWVGTGFFTGDEKAGESTRYSDFAIWELP
jgi:serine/threonine protein kinase